MIGSHRSTNKIAKRLYQRRTWDFSGVKDKDHRKIFQEALDHCDAPFHRIVKRTGHKVPLSVVDLSRYVKFMGDDGHGDIHVGNTPGRDTDAHMLGKVETLKNRMHPHDVSVRKQVLGLFWLPTDDHPAGRVEVDSSTMSNPDLAREVFLAEGAHAYDYGAMRYATRDKILHLLVSASGEQDMKVTPTNTPDDWFEGHGDTYADWPGESFMHAFILAFAGDLPTPLGDGQFVHRANAEQARQIREWILNER